MCKCIVWGKYKDKSCENMQAYLRNNQPTCKFEKKKVLIAYILYHSKRAGSSAITRNV